MPSKILIVDDEPSMRRLLLLLDVMMPKMNGFDVCDSVRNELGRQDASINILTTKDQQVDRSTGEDRGIRGETPAPPVLSQILGRTRTSLIGLHSS